MPSIKHHLQCFLDKPGAAVSSVQCPMVGDASGGQPRPKAKGKKGQGKKRKNKTGDAVKTADAAEMEAYYYECFARGISLAAGKKRVDCPAFKIHCPESRLRADRLRELIPGSG